MAKVPLEERYKGKGIRKCKVCGGTRGLIRKYELHLCRKCFREAAPYINFRKY